MRRPENPGERPFTQNYLHSLRAIARSLSVSTSTVSDLLQRVAALKISWPPQGDMDDARLEALLYPGNTGKSCKRPEPDWNYIHPELRRKGVTLQILWFEYKERNPDGSSPRSRMSFQNSTEPCLDMEVSISSMPWLWILPICLGSYPGTVSLEMYLEHFVIHLSA